MGYPVQGMWQPGEPAGSLLIPLAVTSRILAELPGTINQKRADAAGDVLRQKGRGLALG
jgi:hypothetical protein